MDTMTTVEAVEKTGSGAFKITLLGDVVAGTRDEEIGALAEKLAGRPEANPVSVKLQKLEGGKLLIKEMQEILPPEELGGSDTPAPVAGADVPIEETSPESQEANAKLQEQVKAEGLATDEPLTEGERFARALEEAAAYIRGLQD